MSDLVKLITVTEARRWRRELGQPLAFVPTMGALHDGHLELIQRAQAACPQVVVSIFVNPTQFNDPRDLERYPRPLEQDLEMLQSAGVQTVFLPQFEELYADNYRFQVHEDRDSRLLCGPTRPEHFDGVLTVVLKLLNLLRPQKAFFGKKDFQQLRLIEDMTQALFLDVDIVGVPTVRESDGLAMSSRNRLLTTEQRLLAAQMYQVLLQAKSAEQAKQLLQQAGFAVDYVEEHWGRRFAAAKLGSVRLIDNVEL